MVLGWCGIPVTYLANLVAATDLYAFPRNSISFHAIFNLTCRLILRSWSQVLGFYDCIIAILAILATKMWWLIVIAVLTFQRPIQAQVTVTESLCLATYSTLPTR